MNEKSDHQRRWEALESLRRLITVELSPRTPVVHVTPFCGPNSDLVMVNLYEPTHYWSPAEALAVATALERAAHTTANPPKTEWSDRKHDA